MKKKNMKTLLTALLFLCVLLAAAVPAQAASRKKQTNTWSTQNGYHYYYNADGKKVTGMVKIGSRYYYFDKWNSALWLEKSKKQLLFFPYQHQSQGCLPTYLYQGKRNYPGRSGPCQQIRFQPAQAEADGCSQCDS